MVFEGRQGDGRILLLFWLKYWRTPTKSNDKNLPRFVKMLVVAQPRLCQTKRLGNNFASFPAIDNFPPKKDWFCLLPTNFISLAVESLFHDFIYLYFLATVGNLF